MIYLLAHILHDCVRFFRFNRGQLFLVLALLVVISPKFRRNFWRKRLRYSLESTPEAQRHGGVLVARTLVERGVKQLFAVPAASIQPILDACKVPTVRSQVLGRSLLDRGAYAVSGCTCAGERHQSD